MGMLTDGAYARSSSTLLPASELRVGTLLESVVNLRGSEPLFSDVGGGRRLVRGGETRPSRPFSSRAVCWERYLSSSILSEVLFEKAMVAGKFYNTIGAVST